MKVRDGAAERQYAVEFCLLDPMMLTAEAVAEHLKRFVASGRTRSGTYIKIHSMWDRTVVFQISFDGSGGFAISPQSLQNREGRAIHDAFRGEAPHG